jgi:hypothetical protein
MVPFMSINTLFFHVYPWALELSPFNKLKLFFKKDDFLVEVKRYMKENGSDALEDLIASTVYILLHGNKTYGNLLICTWNQLD